MKYQLLAPIQPELNVIEQILINRGIKQKDIEHYLHTTDKDILNPLFIDNMENGLKMLTKHISQNDKIFVQVDPDCDGYTSAALLINYLYCLFPTFVKNNILYQNHTGKQHGLIIEEIPNDVTMVIAPDSSSNNFDIHKKLQDKGIDVLVIDHHEAEHCSEYACVINNQLCDYPTKSLSGVGMVYKFCSYIDTVLEVDYANQFLDLVALGLIADVMDLRDFETRHLIELGLKSINNPYFKGMVQKNEYQLSNDITPIGVAFYIAPYVNATIRVGTQNEKLTLFESMLDHLAYEMIDSTKKGCKGQLETRVEQACRNCTNIKNRQTKARDASLKVIEEIIEESNLLENKILVIQLDEKHKIDKNLTGLIANQLMDKYKRPVLLLNKVVEKDENKISWEGSARGCNQSEFTNFKDFIQESGLAMYAEG